MHTRAAFGLVFLWPVFAHAVEPDRPPGNGNATVRVRVIEVSLTKAKALGLDGLGQLDGSASQVDRRLAWMVQKSVAKLMWDETAVVAVGSEARIHAGTELTPDLSAKAEAGDAESVFQGTDVSLTPRSAADGRLLIELICKQSRPMSRSHEQPQRSVHDITTVVELADDEAIVLEGDKETRLEDSSRGVFPLVSRVPLVRGRPTTNHNKVQTFVVVSRGGRLLDDAAILKMESD